VGLQQLVDLKLQRGPGNAHCPDNGELSSSRLEHVCARKMTLINALVAVLFGIVAATPYPNLRTYVTDCKSLDYQEYGTGKPIVLLAGGPGMNPAYMVPVAKMLASGGRRVLLLHQRGTGMSANAISCRDRLKRVTSKRVRLAAIEFANRGIGYAVLHASAKGMALYSELGWTWTSEMSKPIEKARDTAAVGFDS
jgi:hypothetical protein